MTSTTLTLTVRRKAALAVLAAARTEEIRDGLAALGPLPDARNVRNPEIGLVMVRGRIGGDGAPFNVGEATVARAAVALPGGEIGHGHVLGRDRDKARLMAICDALIQTDLADRVEAIVIAPIRSRVEADRATAQRRTAATKVDFFTMVRGDA